MSYPTNEIPQHLTPDQYESGLICDDRPQPLAKPEHEKQIAFKHPESPYLEPASPSRIYGRRRRYLWLALLATLVVIAAGVGGGVGGSRASGARSHTTSTS